MLGCQTATLKVAILTLHSQLDLPGLTLTHGVVSLADIDPGLLPPDVVDGEPLLPAHDLSTALSVPDDCRRGVGSRYTGD